jgi:DNA-binding MurR/RpiR family transcriptional regulator
VCVIITIKKGSTIAIITNHSKSPLAKFTDYLFISCKKEVPYEGGTLATVVAQLYIVDMLSVAIFELLGQESQKRSVQSSMEVSDKSI